MEKSSRFYFQCLVVGMLIAILSGFYLHAQDPGIRRIETAGPFTWETQKNFCSFVSDSVNATVTILDTDGTPKPIQPGDVVAAFVDADYVKDKGNNKSVNDLCVGGSTVKNVGIVEGFYAWGDDTTTKTTKEGAEANEPVFFKVWQKSTDRILYGVIVSVKTTDDFGNWVPTDNTWEDMVMKNITLVAAPGISADVTGLYKDVFIKENIFGKAALGLKANTSYDVYVVADKNNWANNDILTRVAGSVATFNTDDLGNMPIGTPLFPNPLNASYDIIVDVNGDGKYSPMIDFLDDNIQIGALVRDPIIEVTFVNRGNSTMTPAPDGSGNIPGISGTIVIKPDDCRTIKDVKLDNASVKNDGTINPVNNEWTYNYTSNNKDRKLLIEFSTKQYTITPKVTGGNGSISPNSPVTVDCGTNRDIIITPNNCYEIDDVIRYATGVTPASDTIQNSAESVKDKLVAQPDGSFKYTFQDIKADWTIEATFKKMGPFTITPLAVQNGSISPSDPVTGIECGSDKSFDITPVNDCYKISDVFVNGMKVEAVINQETGVGKYTFENIKANYNIHATFVKKIYNVTTVVEGNGGITPVSPTVECGANQQFTISPASSCYKVSDFLVDNVLKFAQLTPVAGTDNYTFDLNDIRKDTTVKAVFVIKQFTVTVTKEGNGTIDPSANFTADCGSSKLFTLTPASCHKVSDFLVDGVSKFAQLTPVAGTDNYTFNLTPINKDTTVKAVFVIKQFTVTVTKEGNGTIDPSANFTADCGSSKLFTLTPASCHKVSDFLVDGVSKFAQLTPVAETDNYTFNLTPINKDTTVKAVFVIKQFTVTVTKEGNGTIDPLANFTADCGSSKLFTLTPASCHKVSDFLVDGVTKFAQLTPVAGTDNYTFNLTPINKDTTVKAVFVIKKFTVTVTKEGNGTIDPSADFIADCGSSKLFTLTPASCHKVSDFLVDGVTKFAQLTPVAGTDNYTFNLTPINKDTTVKAVFEIKKYIVNASAGPNGKIIPSGEVSVDCGTDQTFTLDPNDNYRIKEFLVDGVPKLADVVIDPVTDTGTYILKDVKKTYTLSVTFEPKEHTVKVDAELLVNGDIEPKGNVKVIHGKDQLFTIKPDPCYHIDNVFVDGVSVMSDVIIAPSGIGTYILRNVIKEASLHATFDINLYAVTPGVEGNGTISPLAPFIANCGSSKEFTLTPANDCYKVSDILVNGVSDKVKLLPIEGSEAFKYNLTNINKDTTVTAVFEIKKYNIQVSVSGNGTIEPSASFTADCGSYKEFTLVPASACYMLSDILVNDVSKKDDLIPIPGTEAFSYILDNIKSDVTIKAIFIIKVYTVNASAGIGGSIEPQGNVPADCGSSITFKIKPEECYKVQDVVLCSEDIENGGNGEPVSIMGDCHSVLSDVVINPVTGEGTYTLENIDRDYQIVASFVKKTYIIKATAGPNGRIEPKGDVIVNCGDPKTFKFIPNQYYHVLDVKVNGKSIGAPNSYTFPSVKANGTIHVTFEVDPIKLVRASYDVPNTKLTLVFDRPVLVREPDVPCFDKIGMEVDNSGNMDFALSSNPDQNLKERIWVDVGDEPSTQCYCERVVYIDINRAHATTVNLAVAAFISQKADKIDLLLGDEVFKGPDGAMTAPADVPLKMIADGFVLGVKGDGDGTGDLSIYDAGLLLKTSVKGWTELPVYSACKKVDNVLAGFGYTKANTAFYMVDYDSNGVFDSYDASKLLKDIIGKKNQDAAPVLGSGPKIGKLSINDYSNGKLDVSIDLDNSSGVYSADIVLAYDPKMLSVSEVTNAFATSNWLFAEAVDAGKVRIAMAGADQPMDNGSLITMSFNSSSADVIGKLEIIEFKLNGGNLKVEVETLPKAFALLQNYPNPFNPETWIPYQLTEPTEVTITIYNTNGQMVRRLELGNKMPGNYVDKAKAAYWDGRNESGERISSGIYFYQLQAGKENAVRKMIVVK